MMQFSVVQFYQWQCRLSQHQMNVKCSFKIYIAALVWCYHNQGRLQAKTLKLLFWMPTMGPGHCMCRSFRRTLWSSWGTELPLVYTWTMLPHAMSDGTKALFVRFYCQVAESTFWRVDIQKQFKLYYGKNQYLNGHVEVLSIVHVSNASLF